MLNKYGLLASEGRWSIYFLLLLLSMIASVLKHGCFCDSYRRNLFASWYVDLQSPSIGFSHEGASLAVPYALASQPPRPRPGVVKRMRPARVGVVWRSGWSSWWYSSSILQFKVVHSSISSWLLAPLPFIVMLFSAGGHFRLNSSSLKFISSYWRSSISSVLVNGGPFAVA